MYRKILAAIFVAALVAAPLAPANAETEKKLTPQQQKMKDCGAKWQDYKKEKNVKGQTEYRKFLSTCLKS